MSVLEVIVNVVGIRFLAMLLVTGSLMVEVRRREGRAPARQAVSQKRW